jgi:hypothetical protein
MERRTLLKLGVASGAALALLGGGAALLFEPAWRDGRLSPNGETIFVAVARAVLDGSLPIDTAARRSALGAHLERMSATLRSMSPSAQTEVARLLALLSTPPGRLAMAGLTSDWESAQTPQIQLALKAMRTSRLLLRRQAYHALRDLTHAAYFSDRSTWTQLGYPGPAQNE